MKVEKTHAKTVSDLLFRVEVIQEEKAHLAHRSIYIYRERERERERREKAHLAHRSTERGRERERAREREREREERRHTWPTCPYIRERERVWREGTLGLHVHIYIYICIYTCVCVYMCE